MIINAILEGTLLYFLHLKGPSEQEHLVIDNDDFVVEILSSFLYYKSTLFCFLPFSH